VEQFLMKSRKTVQADRRTLLPGQRRPVPLILSAFVLCTSILLLLAAAPSSWVRGAEPRTADGWEPMPLHFFTKNDRIPTFIPAVEVFDARGRLKEAEIGRGSSKDVRTILDLQKDINDCRSWDSTLDYQWDAPSTLEEAMTTVDNVLLTRVTGMTEGFYSSLVGTLVRLETEEVLKGEESLATTQYIFLPVADFTVGKQRICRTNDTYPPLPELDDRVVLSFNFYESFRDATILPVGAGNILVFSGDRVSTGKSLRAAIAEKGVEDTLTHIRNLIEADPQ
jgi:hypothetical protein